MSSPSAPTPANLHLLPFTSVPEEHTSPSTPVSYSAVIAPLSPSASPYWLVSALDFCREHRVMPILTTLTTESSLRFFPPCVSLTMIGGSEWLLGQENRIQILLKIYFGGVHRSKKNFFWTSKLCCVPKNHSPQNLKWVQMRAEGRRRRRRRSACAWLYVCWCRGGLKRRGQSLRIHSHRNEANRQPDVIISFRTKWGCGGVGLTKESRYADFFMTPLQNDKCVDVQKLNLQLRLKT